MMNYSVNSNPCDARPAESSCNPPEETGSWIPTCGVPLLLTLRTPEGYNLVTAECPAPNPENLEGTFCKIVSVHSSSRELVKITRLLCLCVSGKGGETGR